MRPLASTWWEWSLVGVSVLCSLLVLLGIVWAGARYRSAGLPI